MKPIDINCDLGEGIGNEAELMPYLSSCNVACGGHAGDSDTMRQVARLAKKHGVKIGAHPSFPDPKNFGRTVMSMSPESLKAALTTQIEAFIEILKQEGLKLHHIKPHGALYNLAAKDSETANVVVEVLKHLGPDLVLYVPYNSEISKLAMHEGVTIAYEAFMDRNYNDDLSLVSRQQSNALITDPTHMVEHVYRIITEEKVQTISGKKVDLKADTFCIHGDGEDVVRNLKIVTQKLREHNLKII